MGIRNNNKNRLSPDATGKNSHGQEIPVATTSIQSPLIFWTKGHTDNSSVLVNLTVFGTGESSRRASGRWAGPFSGRPQLILELAPIIASFLEYRSPSLVSTYIKSLREWWRVFDLVELRSSGSKKFIVSTVADIKFIHRQTAIDGGMATGVFGVFVRVANARLTADGLPQLHWIRPRTEPKPRHIPAPWQVDKIRLTLKARWFKTLDTWQRADRLTSGGNPSSEEEHRLIKNYRFLQDAAIAYDHPRPSFFDGENPIKARDFHSQELNLADMLAGFYPNAQSVRVAFHLCQLQSGWNAAVLLSLDVNDDLIEPHPKDPKRYILRGFKHRAKTHQISEGLFKTQGSPGGIISELIRRTEPLRNKLKNELNLLERRINELGFSNKSPETLHSLRLQTQKLRLGIASPWLFVTRHSQSIQWLNEASAISSGKSGGSTFLEELVQDINQMQPEDMKIHRINGSDFRDAFAASVYSGSGGLALHVMKALGHRSLKSTQVYLDNNIINEQADKLYSKFSDSLWHEIKISKRVEPSVLAKWARDGQPSDDERLRLNSYRMLLRSRLDIGCKNPTQPPKTVAPNFTADGNTLCPVQRCTLCEHAVVFPESIQGLAKRVAELRYIKSRMSIALFLNSSFDEELNNTEEILKFYDSEKADTEIEKWIDLISKNKHRAIEFDGL